jgi:hypothetical protein
LTITLTTTALLSHQATMSLRGSARTS